MSKIFESKVLNNNIKEIDPMYFYTPSFGSFTCGGNVTKWTVAASDLGKESSAAELQIWRHYREGGQQYEKLASVKLDSTSLMPTSHPNVYDIIQTERVRFEAGYWIVLNLTANATTKFYYAEDSQTSSVAFFCDVTHQQSIFTCEINRDFNGRLLISVETGNNALVMREVWQ